VSDRLAIVRALEALEAGDRREAEAALLLGALEDVLARIVWLREEFDPSVREQALEDIELDLAADLEELRRAA